MNSTLLDYDDSYLKQLEEVEGQSFVRTVGLAVFCIYVIALLFGVPGNVYVLYRLFKLAKYDTEKYANGTGSGLFAMATADLLALLFISVHNVFSGISLNISHWIASLLCKVSRSSILSSTRL
uniref:G-protein coupled receptors family 1 profile domain-containing protein n=1 Tax=Plectus sambesii TaxID=2011161 RepID=A0A914XME9_9BILA